MKAISFIGVMLVAIAAGQGGPSTKPNRPWAKAPVIDSAPVTQAEARTSFVRAEAIFRRALQLSPAKPSVSIPDGSGVATREAIVAEMTRFYGAFRAQIKLTPHAVVYRPEVLKIGTSQRANLERLIRLGAIAKLGPLATASEKGLTVPQFGDALGFFLARLAYMTHLPSSKWTPALRKEEE